MVFLAGKSYHKQEDDLHENCFYQIFEELSDWITCFLTDWSVKVVVDIICFDANPVNDGDPKRCMLYSTMFLYLLASFITMKHTVLYNYGFALRKHSHKTCLNLCYVTVYRNMFAPLCIIFDANNMPNVSYTYFLRYITKLSCIKLH